VEYPALLMGVSSMVTRLLGPVAEKELTTMCHWLRDQLRRATRAIISMILVGLFSVALCEGALRAAGHVVTLPLLFDNSYNRFRPAPGTLKYGFPINSHGFSDVEFQTAKRQNTYRILGVGDSFAFGVVPYEDEYLTLLKHSITRQNEAVEVINMGIPNTGPADYLSLIAREGLPLSPNMVLLSFFVGNDFTDNAPPERGHIVRHLLSNLYLSRLARALIALSKGVPLAPIFTRYDDNSVTFDNATYLKIEAERANILRRDAQSERLFRAAAGFLDEISDLCRARGIKLVVLIIPDELQVDHALRERVISYAGLSEDALDIRLPNAFLHRALEERGVPYIDVLDPFMRNASSQLYRKNDSHWNIRGNRFAADLVAHALPAIDPGFRATP
jgi:hypothetical protein